MAVETRKRVSPRPRRPGAVAAWALLALATTTALSAQVGHPPNDSPYRDTPDGNTIVFGVGYLGGSRGIVGVGPSDGVVGTVRYERPVGRTFALMLTLGDALTTRYVQEPTEDSLVRTSGPVGNALFIVDVGALMRLTGGKSWHGLVPTVGVSIGAAIGNYVTADSSQYSFDTKVIFGPEAGLRWYVSRPLSVRLTVRTEWWRLSYPLQFQTPAPDGSRVLAANASTTEWTVHPLATFGLGWIF